MLDGELIRGWSDEAAEAGDMLLAALLLYIGTLRNCSDDRGLEIMKNYARMRVRDATGEEQREEWPDTIGA